MIHKPRSIRTRLTAINLAIVTVTLVGVSIVVVGLRERELLAEFDDRLQEHAEIMLESIGPAAGIGGDRPAVPRLVPFRFPGYYFQIRRPDGSIQESSHNLQDARLPIDRPPQAGATRLETVTVTVGEEPPRQLRLLTVAARNPEGNAYYFQIGRDRSTLQGAIRGLRRMVFTVVPLAIILSGVASYLVSRHALAPIRRIVSDTRAVSADSLYRRLPTPSHDDEMAELVNTLNDMLARVDHAFAAQDRFIAHASHELRTPISVVMGLTSVLKQQSRTPEEYDRFAGSIEDEVRGMASTVNSLLILSKAAAGLPPGAAKVVSINDAVMEAVGRCQSLAGQREVRLVTRLASADDRDREPNVRGDAQLLATGVGNLLRNAIRHSPVEQPVSITVSFDDQAVEVAVRDHGPGIDPAHADRVFDRFYSVPAETAGYQGVGLGLAIVKQVAEVHGGWVRFAHPTAGGCVFTLHLPAVHAAAPKGDHG